MRHQFFQTNVLIFLFAGNWELLQYHKFTKPMLFVLIEFVICIILKSTNSLTLQEGKTQNFLLRSYHAGCCTPPLSTSTPSTTLMSATLTHCILNGE